MHCSNLWAFGWTAASVGTEVKNMDIKSRKQRHRDDIKANCGLLGMGSNFKNCACLC